MSGVPALASSPVATIGVIRALLDQAQSKGYHGGALGVRARPLWTDERPVEPHAGVPVRVVACTSALAVREALLERSHAHWLVILTDRDEADLGAGVLTHLVWHRLRTPEPWDAVRESFQANGLDGQLFTGPAQRELALGLLACRPAGAGWPPAPGGVLTRDHALAAVARAHLHVAEQGSVIDATAVLEWTTNAQVSAQIAALRSLGGDVVAGSVLGWMARLLGAAAAPVEALLTGGLAADVVPLGLVVGVVATPGTPVTAEVLQTGREALARLEARLGGAPSSEEALRAWSRDSADLVGGMLLDRSQKPNADRIVVRADALLREVHAEALADRSRLLPAGLGRRLARCAEAVGSAVAGAGHAVALDADGPAVPESAAAQVEPAWAAVIDHHLADGDHRVTAFRAAVRLMRWLTQRAHPAASTYAALVDRHRDVDAWVDAASSDAARGVGDAALATALGAVLGAVRERRRAHDRAFAAALVAATRAEEDDVPGVETVMTSTVLPLARRTPVLLLVLDGMSAAVATEVVGDITARTADGWVEAVPAGQARRGVACAVLPTLTAHSRASLLCGELATGTQAAELAGFERLTRAAGLAGAQLFHKKPIEVSPPGLALAPDVAAALDDVTTRPLVACVLNAIDDALDRSDPGGTDWGMETVRHLRPLLERARMAGRTVILTADHGHVIERRLGTQRPAPDLSSGRSRGCVPAPGVDEVLVTGRRVLAHGGSAVLAVDEDLRYGPLKAGYHGGASPAEVLVPVCILVQGVAPDPFLELAPPQEPWWWWTPVQAVTDGASPTPRPFSDVTALPLFAALPPVDAPPARAGALLAGRLLASSTYAEQRSLAGRAPMADERVGALLALLVDTDGHRLSPEAAALALAQPTGRLRGAVAQVQRLLNVEGYPVLTVDADGVTLVLDVPLLREQFEL